MSKTKPQQLIFFVLLADIITSPMCKFLSTGVLNFLELKILISFKARLGLALSYITELLSPCESARSL